MSLYTTHTIAHTYMHIHTFVEVIAARDKLYQAPYPPDPHPSDPNLLWKRLLRSARRSDGSSLCVSGKGSICSPDQEKILQYYNMFKIVYF